MRLCSYYIEYTAIGQLIRITTIGSRPLVLITSGHDVPTDILGILYYVPTSDIPTYLRTYVSNLVMILCIYVCILTRVFDAEAAKTTIRYII